MNSSTWTSPEHRRSVLWIVTLAAVAIVFDGYDLVVYGTVLPTLLDDPGQLGELTPGDRRRTRVLRAHRRDDRRSRRRRVR